MATANLYEHEVRKATLMQKFTIISYNGNTKTFQLISISKTICLCYDCDSATANYY